VAPGYANNAYDRMTEADAAWMARIVSRFGDAHIRAMVERARFSDPIVASELARILIGRRDRILARWLTRLSPLTWPQVRADDPDGPTRLCMQDLAVHSGIRDARWRRYRAEAWTGDPYAPIEMAAPPTRADDDYVCVGLPRVPDATADQPGYLVVDVTAQSPEHETAFPVRVHLYDLGGEYRIAGLERPSHREPPQ